MERSLHCESYFYHTQLKVERARMSDGMYKFLFNIFYNNVVIMRLTGG